jgi:hypothetical protein
MPAQPAAAPLNTRYAALLEVASELGSRAAGVRAARRRSALLGLHCLGAFAAKQFTLFDKGFANGWLAPDKEFPPAFLLEATARQVGHDIDVLLRTVGQRDAENTTAAMRDTLAQADRLAAAALLPAVRHQLIEETAVLTYFEKAPTVRLLPYAPLALIGIDLTAIHDTPRLLAIAHEAGHHVYRQMTVNYATEVDEQVAERMAARLAAPAAEEAQPPAWLLAWEEEIFADVYSVLVAGPVAGLSIQAMLMAEIPALLLYDDADHPLGALRPEIAVLVLQKLAALDRNAAARLQTSADRLAGQWRGYLAEHNIGESFTPADGGAPVALTEARRHLDAHIDALLRDELAPLAAAARPERWSKGLADAATPLAELYAQFSAACLQLGDDAIPELTLAGDKKVAVAPQIAGVKGGQRVVGQIGDPYLDGLRDEALAGKRTLASGAWKAVFLAGDWVTEEGGSGITPVK